MNHPTRDFDQIAGQFQAIAEHPLETARRWKTATNGKVVGCVGLHVPEEVISAAGMLPVLLLEKEGPIVEAMEHVQSNMCGYIRSVADDALTGELTFLDSLVILDSCHVIRMIGDSLRHSAPDVARIDFLSFPVSLQGAGVQPYLLGELASFARRMESVAGRPIDDASLRDAIRMHNANRRLLQRLYAMRRDHPGLISAVQVAAVVKASMCMPKDEHSLLLSELLESLDSRKHEPESTRVPIVVSGSLCESCDGILQALEDAGASIVDDDLFVGSRYFNTLVDETREGLAALASAYLGKAAPCPTITRTDHHLGAYLGAMVRQANAVAVVSIVVKYCEPHYYAYLMARRQLKALAVAEYMVEKEREAESEGQIKTRLRAFLETIETGACNG